MGTLRRVLIKNVEKEVIAELIQRSYSIGRMAIIDYEDRAIFLDRLNPVFILFDAYLDGWVELEPDFHKSVEEHDDFWTMISREYNTTVIFGYEQTTSDDARLLLLENGIIKRSVYQKSYYNPHRLVMEHDTGERLKYELNFHYPKPGEEMGDCYYLDFDDIQEMFTDCGYRGIKRVDFDEKYLHLEYLK